MPIVPVGAFRASDGTCYQNKQQAYTADITHFCRSLPRADNKPPIAKEFGKLVRDVKAWLEGATALELQMKEEADVETKRSIAGQG